MSYSFGPGPITPAVRALIAVNAVLFVIGRVVHALPQWLGLVPAQVFGHLWIWQPVTYMFVHAGLTHLLFNMLTLWMFGVDLERRWGTRFFTRFYFVAGIGAAVTTLAVAAALYLSVSGDSSESVATMAGQIYLWPTVGASGAIYGLLMAFAVTYPDRPILVFLLFPVPARIAVLLFGALAFYLSYQPSGGVAHVTHLGGLLVGYLYLAGRRGQAISAVRSQWLRWRMARLRKRFEVHDGGRKGPGGPWVH